MMMLVACGNNADAEMTYDELIDMAFEDYEENKQPETDNEPDFGVDKRKNSNITIWEGGKYIKIVMHAQNKEGYTGTIFYEYLEDGTLKPYFYDEDREPIEEKEPDYIEEQGEIIKE